ncbi:MAG: SDR family NAD(P)-dependent oxidoreductase [Anaerolineae bacterium]|nr:SDR family NAD(P)-dependent oxidoreductase [Anaerolineae bacterium]
MAIVTGAGRGMGRVIALTLAREGAAVVVNDLRSAWAEAVAQEIQAAGGQALAYAGDISREDNVNAMVQAAVALLAAWISWSTTLASWAIHVL